MKEKFINKKKLLLYPLIALATIFTLPYSPRFFKKIKKELEIKKSERIRDLDQNGIDDLINIRGKDYKFFYGFKENEKIKYFSKEKAKLKNPGFDYNKLESSLKRN